MGSEPCGNLLTWAEALLIGRAQSVLVDGIRSKEETVLFRVTEGTAIRPLLFMLYINDLPAHVELSSCHLFADYWLLHRGVESIEDQAQLHRDHNNLKRWASEWGIVFNACQQRPITATIPTWTLWNHPSVSGKWEIPRHHVDQWPIMVPTHK